VTQWSGAACRLLVAAVAAAAAGGATPAASAESPDVLNTYEPVLLFHPSEDWAPERVETFLATARVERQIARGSWAPFAGPLPTSTAGCAFNPCFRLNLPCRLRGGDGCYERVAERTDWRRPVVYGRVVPVPPGSPPPTGFPAPPRYLVRYWLFYEFDDWHSPRKRLWQAHEGDWESITVGVGADGLPQFAAYSQHCSGSVRAWSRVSKRGGTHPVAYVALGSHANYFAQTTSSTRFTECLEKGLAATAAAKAARIVRRAQDRVTDRTGTAHALGPAGLAGTTPLALVPLDPAKTGWARFPGRWSEGQLLWLGSVPTPVTSLSQGAGPATPRWTSTSIPSLWHVESN
jgi:hypothetical protein